MLWRATLAFAVGLLWANAVGGGAGPAAKAGGVVLAVAFAAGRRPWLREFAICAVMLACGVMALAGPLARASAEILEAPRDLIIEATVCGSGGSLSRPHVDLCRGFDVEEPERAVPSRIRMGAPDDPGAIAGLDDLVSGHRVRARVRLLPLQGASNPGARDWRRRFERQGIAARARLLDAALIVRLSSRDDFIAPGVAGVVTGFRAVRREIARRLSEYGTGGGLLRALVLGDRSGLSEAQRAMFANLGIAHLLAVSGLHVALVAGFAFVAGLALLRNTHRVAAHRDARKAALAWAVCAAVAYGALAGWGIPVRRALIFLVVIAATVGLRRTVRPTQPLALGALVLLAVEPHALFEASAQLSFAATAALLVASGATSRETGRSDNSFAAATVSLMRTSATAMVATAPVLAAHGVPLGAAGLVTNLIAVPWVTFVLLPAALFAAVVACVPENAAGRLLLELSTALAGASFEVVALVDRWQPVSPATGAPSAASILVSLLGVGWALRLHATWARVAVCACVIGGLQLAPRASIDPAPPRVVFFDVGQGDAILVQGRSGAVLVDGGRAVPGRFDQGRRVVVPGLRALGVAELDAVVATHADIDHRGGLEAILRSIPTRELWLPPHAETDSGFGSLFALARRMGIRIRNVAAGDQPRVFGDVRLETLWPRRDQRAATRND
ncbi:MAG: DNA internalization-related competence protein ComEC/Rec2, partial [Myxococcota bacterium]|nr:DNA internalization-related competence protein ComEC/Rec2 [Myxococcota bacterium]